MPRYSWDVEDILFEEDVRKMYDRANPNEAALISLLWLTGARPGEIALLKVQDVTYSSDKLSILLKTLKRRKGGEFKVKERTLGFSRTTGFNTNIYIETIVSHVSKLPNDSETKVLGYTTRWMEKKINKLGEEAIGKKLSPYHFRHSVMTWLAKNGYTMDRLKYFKGSTLQSVEPYIHAQPQLIKIENMRRSRAPIPKEEPKKEEEPEQVQESEQTTEEDGKDGNVELQKSG